MSSTTTPKASTPARRSGIDALLTCRGKALSVGQEVRLTLIKTASGVETRDPVNPQAPPEAFPVVAKFPESVVKPNFKLFKRFYQQDIPSQKVRFVSPVVGQQPQSVHVQRHDISWCPWHPAHVQVVLFFQIVHGSNHFLLRSLSSLG